MADEMTIEERADIYCPRDEDETAWAHLVADFRSERRAAVEKRDAEWRDAIFGKNNRGTWIYEEFGTPEEYAGFKQEGDKMDRENEAELIREAREDEKERWAKCAEVCALLQRAGANELFGDGAASRRNIKNHIADAFDEFASELRTADQGGGEDE